MNSQNRKNVWTNEVFFFHLHGHLMSGAKNLAGKLSQADTISQPHKKFCQVNS